MDTSDTAAPGSFRMPRLAHASVEDAMHPGVISCSPDTPLREVARIISNKHIHCLVVTSAVERGAPPTWGLISGLDIVGAATGTFEERTAADVAATEPVTVSTDDPLDRAVQLMIEHQVEHLIVVGAESSRPVGVLSTLDVAGVMAWGEV